MTRHSLQMMGVLVLALVIGSVTGPHIGRAWEMAVGPIAAADFAMPGDCAGCTMGSDSTVTQQACVGVSSCAPGMIPEVAPVTPLPSVAPECDGCSPRAGGTVVPDPFPPKPFLFV